MQPLSMNQLAYECDHLFCVVQISGKDWFAWARCVRNMKGSGNLLLCYSWEKHKLTLQRQGISYVLPLMVQVCVQLSTIVTMVILFMSHVSKKFHSNVFSPN